MLPNSCGLSRHSSATSPAQYPAGSGVGVSVLLRQPHGFEGLRMVREELHTEDLALAQGVDVRVLHVGLGATAFATPDEPRRNAVANIDEVADLFKGVGIPRVAELLDLAPDRLPTYVGSRLRPT